MCTSLWCLPIDSVWVESLLLFVEVCFAFCFGLQCLFFLFSLLFSAMPLWCLVSLFSANELCWLIADSSILVYDTNKHGLYACAYHQPNGHGEKKKENTKSQNYFILQLKGEDNEWNYILLVNMLCDACHTFEHTICVCSLHIYYIYPNKRHQFIHKTHTHALSHISSPQLPPATFSSLYWNSVRLNGYIAIWFSQSISAIQSFTNLLHLIRDFFFRSDFVLLLCIAVCFYCKRCRLLPCSGFLFELLIIFEWFNYRVYHLLSHPSSMLARGFSDSCGHISIELKCRIVFFFFRSCYRAVKKLWNIDHWLKFCFQHVFRSQNFSRIHTFSVFHHRHSVRRSLSVGRTKKKPFAIYRTHIHVYAQ